eukprot:scaffold221_cov122-Isochrysis_galbana.AAC.6
MLTPLPVALLSAARRATSSSAPPSMSSGRVAGSRAMSPSKSSAHADRRKSPPAAGPARSTRRFTEATQLSPVTPAPPAAPRRCQSGAGTQPLRSAPMAASAASRAWAKLTTPAASEASAAASPCAIEKRKLSSSGAREWIASGAAALHPAASARRASTCSVMPGSARTAASASSFRAAAPMGRRSGCHAPAAAGPGATLPCVDRLGPSAGSLASSGGRGAMAPATAADDRTTPPPSPPRAATPASTIDPKAANERSTADKSNGSSSASVAARRSAISAMRSIRLHGRGGRVQPSAASKIARTVWALSATRVHTLTAASSPSVPPTPPVPSTSLGSTPLAISSNRARRLVRPATEEAAAAAAARASARAASPATVLHASVQTASPAPTVCAMQPLAPAACAAPL